MKQFEVLIQEHFEALTNIANQNLQVVDDLLKQQLDSGSDFEKEILENSSAVVSSVIKLSDITMINAAIEGRASAKQEMEAEVQA